MDVFNISVGYSGLVSPCVDLAISYVTIAVQRSYARGLLRNKNRIIVMRNLVAASS
ncbi:hypothetical protein K449DRAFT_383310 [Hypoxylon sp. EC38]|nr:hypothetical protein K449DRAFT_383310 [Hypoxylon sp. EC38]